MAYPVNHSSRRPPAFTVGEEPLHQPQGAARGLAVEPSMQQTSTTPQVPQQLGPMRGSLDRWRSLRAETLAAQAGFPASGGEVEPLPHGPQPGRSAPAPTPAPPAPEISWQELPSYLSTPPLLSGGGAAAPDGWKTPRWQEDSGQAVWSVPPPGPQSRMDEWRDTLMHGLSPTLEPPPAYSLKVWSPLDLSKPPRPRARSGWSPMMDPDYAREHEARSRGAVVTENDQLVKHPDGRGGWLYKAGFVDPVFKPDAQIGPHLIHQDDHGTLRKVSVHDMRPVTKQDRSVVYEFHFRDGKKDPRTGMPQREEVAQGDVPYLTIEAATGRRMGQVAQGTQLDLGYDRNTRARVTLPEVEAALEKDHRQGVQKVRDADQRWRQAQAMLPPVRQRVDAAQRELEALAQEPDQFREDAAGGISLLTRGADGRRALVPVDVNDRRLFSRASDHVRRRKHALHELQQAQAAHTPLAQGAAVLRKEVEKQRQLYLASQMLRRRDLAQRRNAAVDSPYERLRKKKARSLSENPRVIRRDIALRLEEEGLLESFPELAPPPGAEPGRRYTERQVADLGSSVLEALERATGLHEEDEILTRMGLNPENLRDLVQRGHLSPEDGQLFNETLNEGHASHAARQQAEERPQHLAQLLAHAEELGISEETVRQRLAQLGEGSPLPALDSDFLDTLKPRSADELEAALAQANSEFPEMDAERDKVKQYKWYDSLSKEEQKLLKERLSDRIVAAGFAKVADQGNTEMGRTLELPVSDMDVSAKQLFYQWVKGTGPSQRHFNEDSTMGRELMTTPYVTEAVQQAIENMYFSGKPSVGEAKRSLGDGKGRDWPGVYLPNLVFDATVGNNTYALHGSMAVRAEVGRPFLRNGKTYLPVKVTGTDDLSAISGARLPPFLGGYTHNKSAFSKDNPFGEKGPFRTITTTYDLQFAVEQVPGMNVPGAWSIDPEKIQPVRPPTF